MKQTSLAISTSLTLMFSFLIAALPREANAKTVAQTAAKIRFDALTPGQLVSGFRTEAVYLNDSDQPFGARFRHARTGFTLDFLEMQSVPQALMWVNSFPTSDRGEPHTQEHLLLGKGNIGRSHSGLETMSLAGSTAFTMQWRTVYQLHTAAGPAVFYKLFESETNSLLHPDYTDEEIRREVSHWGVNEDPADKSLRLEEKGTVYLEMVSSYERPINRLFRNANQMLYGPQHPLALSAGGWPAAIREMKAENIRRFHADNYHLGNMGMVASFPKDMPAADVLRELDQILNRLEPKPIRRNFLAESDLPSPQPATPGRIELVRYPNKNEQQPGWMMFAWPAARALDTRDKALLSLFLQNVSGDATTNLYKMFVDTKTRVMDTGAKGAFGFLDDELVVGNPVFIGLTDVVPANMTEEKISEVRTKILEELNRIASFKDGSPELAEFNQRLASRVIESRRTLSKFVNSPPNFGFRSSDAGWMSHLIDLNRTPGFRKSVTLKPELATIDALLNSKQNFWREYLTKWQLINSVPYAVAAKPAPELGQQEEQGSNARAAAEAARLRSKYGVSTDKEALTRFKTEYDATTAELEREAKQSATMKFLEKPPLTLDDQLDFKVMQDPSGVPLVASRFDNMTSATTGIALRLDGVPQDQLVYLSMLPTLLTQTGVIKDGKAISYEDMSEMLRKEILSLNGYFGTNFKTGRAELIMRGAGNDLGESKRAIDWMKLVLSSPDWRPENLARIRDVVDQTLGRNRNRMQAAEENWVNDPADAYWRQDNPLLLTTASFLTRGHNVQRLRWMLKDPGATPAAISNFLASLSGAAAQRQRDELKSLLGALQGKKDVTAPAGLKRYVDEFAGLSESDKALAVEAAKDLEQVMEDIPDGSLAADWEYLVRETRHDLLIPPAKALANLTAVRQSLLKTGGARMFQIGSQVSQTALEPNVRSLIAGLDQAPLSPAKYSTARLIETRLIRRLGGKAAPVYVGLMNPNTQGGVFLNSAPAVSYFEADNRELVLDYLASRLYGGGGAHGIFIKTWGAGLAYSNGFSSSLPIGRMGYYAERTPELPQTLRFVIGELKKAQPDPGLVEYAIAGAFGTFRSASAYEARGEAMAADIADGLTPDVIRHFRQSILTLRSDPKLSDELFKRMTKVYARVLPGFGTKASDVAGGVFYVIGPEKQISAYEQYLKTVEGDDARLYRIYPRDYWMTLKELE